jgi:hypothetical protein
MKIGVSVSVREGGEASLGRMDVRYQRASDSQRQGGASGRCTAFLPLMHIEECEINIRPGGWRRARP